MHEPLPLGCDREAAIRFLGCSDTKFEDLTARKVIKRLCNGWYSYRMLSEAFAVIEKEAESGKVIDIQEKIKNNEKRQTIRSKGNQPVDRQAEELLFPSQSGRC